MNIKLRKAVGSIPLVGPVARWFYRKMNIGHAVEFRKSDQYWEDRYRVGGNSGSGSYGRLAEFKAQFLNDFVEKNKISTVLEFGCGDGAQLLLAEYENYLGFDVAPSSVAMCRERFKSNPNYCFHLVGSDEFKNIKKANLSLSLDVIYHLIEDDVYDEYMRKLFECSKRFVIIYAYDFEKIYELKHEKGRNFTKWVTEFAPDWELIDRTSNKYPYDKSDPNNTSQSDFYTYLKKN